MKVGQSIEYSKKNVFLQKSCNTWGRENSCRPFCFLKILHRKKKQTVSNLVLIHCGSLHLEMQQNELNKNSDCWSTDMLNFSFSGKGLGLVSSPHFVYGFLRKMFFMLCSLNWPNFIAWLSLFSRYLAIRVLQLFVYQPVTS